MTLTRRGFLSASAGLALTPALGVAARSAPLPREAVRCLRWANALSVRLRAAVDLPSGLDEPDAFRADFTYATGVVKFSSTPAALTAYIASSLLRVTSA